MKSRKYFTTIFLACVLGIFSFHTNSAQTLAQTNEKVLRYVNYYPVGFRSLNPPYVTEDTEYTITYHILEGLMRIYQYKLQYGMADSYEISTDGCVYTFHIREDACYSDGTPVLAEDFVRSFQRMISERADSNYIAIIKHAAAIRDGLLEVDALGVTAIDQHTLRIELEHAQSQFLRYLVLPCFSPMRADAADALRAQDCNGPFYLNLDVEGNICRLEKNPYYWEHERIALDAIESVFCSNMAQAHEAFLNGQVDVMPLATESIDTPSDGVYRRVTTGTCDHIYFDLDTDGPLQCKNLRLALNYALDREAYGAALGNGLIEPIARCVPPFGEGICQRYIEAYPDHTFPLKGNLELAEENLNHALEALGLSSPDEICLPFLVHDDYWSRREASVVAQQWEEKLGIQISFTYVDDAELKKNVKNGGLKLSGEGEEFADPAEYLGFWDYDYAPKDPDSSSVQFREYLKQASIQSDEQIRFNTLYEAEKILLEDAAMIPLHIRWEMLLLNPNLTGFETSADLSGGGYDFLYADFE